MNIDDLKFKIEDYLGRDLLETERNAARNTAIDLLEALEDGTIRAAEPQGENWIVHAWVKKGILLAFQVSDLEDYSINRHFQYRDKDLLKPLPWLGRSSTLRVVPGGTQIRRGSYIGENVIVMPPAYINVGAYIGSGSMIDSHALVGSCAQIGSDVHLSAGAQIGGVLEPVGSVPVIIEDNVFVGGNAGIFEGVLIRENAIIAAGCLITNSTPVFDLVNETILKPEIGEPLIIPKNAIVIPGSRPASGQFAKQHSLNYHTPLIVKYRDPEEPAFLALESALRI